MDNADRPAKRPRLGTPAVLDQRMKAFGVPPIVLLLLIALSEQGGLHSPGPDLDAVDFFAGCVFITHALRVEGYTVAPYEIEMDGWGRGVHDLLSTRGFVHSCQLVRRLRPSGLILGAPPCST